MMFRAFRHAAIAAGLAVSACASYPEADVSKMRFVEAAGVTTHVETWGAGEPVFLIHGASSHIGTWEPTVVPLLKNEFLVAAYDRPGMGYTADRPANANTLALQAKVAAEVIEKLGLKTYTQEVDTPTGRRTRVRVGPFETKAEADAAGAKLKGAGLPVYLLLL